jgi:hypothetical protein
MSRKEERVRALATLAALASSVLAVLSVLVFLVSRVATLVLVICSTAGVSIAASVIVVSILRGRRDSRKMDRPSRPHPAGVQP